MKVDLSRVLVGVDGKPALDGEEPLTLHRVCSVSLFAGLRDQQETDMAKVDKCWELRSRLKADEPMDLKAEDVTFLKERVGKIYGSTPGIAGQARWMLDQEG